LSDHPAQGGATSSQRQQQRQLDRRNKLQRLLAEALQPIDPDAMDVDEDIANGGSFLF
jgi:hypothetical protein